MASSMLEITRFQLNTVTAGPGDHVHQIYGDGVTPEWAQVVLSDVLDALAEFEVPQAVISIMLRTSPDNMHVFNPSEILALKLNRGGDS